MSDNRPPGKHQLSPNLPGPTVYLTGHSPSAAAVLQSKRPLVWSNHDDDQLAMSVAYTTSFPADLNNDADIVAHDTKMATGPFGLVTKGGTVLRYVDFAPGYECMMHRTQSLDYGIVLEGQIVSVLDSGEETVMKRGDVMIQRATMHSWRNDSATEWARMIFCLQDIKPILVNGKHLGEDLGRGTSNVPPSGNDAEDT